MPETTSLGNPSNVIPLPKQKPAWLKGRIANLVRYGEGGNYYARARVKGVLIRRCLKTKSEVIAKIKLDKLLEKERARIVKTAAGEMTCGKLMVEYVARIESNPDLKPMTKRYRRQTAQIIREVWPELGAMQPQKVGPQEAATFAGKLRAKYAASRFNGTLETLRAIFQLGIELGAVAENPVTFENRKKGIKGIKRGRLVSKDWRLPSPAEFTKLVARLNALPSRLRASRAVRFLAYSGLRLGAAQKVKPSDVDLKRNYLSKPPIKYTDVPQRLPMFRELRKVCEELLADYPGEGPLLPIRNPRKALRNSCIECGLEPLTNHALRHLFATRCLESGVDVRTVASWLDHRDNGALLLKRYSHVIDQHSQRMARRVKF